LNPVACGSLGLERFAKALRMWTTENRCRYDRRGLRYPSDVTDAEWALIGGIIPPAKRVGNARTVNLHEVVNGLLYVLGTGGQWRAIPQDLPPRSTLHGDCMRWEWDGTLGPDHHAQGRRMAEPRPASCHQHDRPRRPNRYRHHVGGAENVFQQPSRQHHARIRVAIDHEDGLHCVWRMINLHPS
jgi:hypothetical protein